MLVTGIRSGETSSVAVKQPYREAEQHGGEEDAREGKGSRKNTHIDGTAVLSARKPQQDG